MTEGDVRRLIGRTFFDDPQRLSESIVALERVYTGLTTLTRLGLPFVLEEGNGYVPIEWPKVYYHQVFGEKIVHSPKEAGALGPGWHFEQPKPYLIPGVDGHTPSQ